MKEAKKRFQLDLNSREIETLEYIRKSLGENTDAGTFRRMLRGYFLYLQMKKIGLKVSIKGPRGEADNPDLFF